MSVDCETMGSDANCRQILATGCHSSDSSGPTMSTAAATSISSPVLHSHKLDKTMEALSLVSVRALLALMLWYLFSFGAIFLNKYVVDMLNAEMIIFCEY